MEQNKINALLNSFECKRNDDIQNFIRQKSCMFERQSLCRTYLVFRENDHTQILAYYSLTTKDIFAAPCVTKSQLKALRASGSDGNLVKSCLIGQLGKNSAIEDNPISLKSLLDHVFTQVKQIQDLVGGTAITLECENVESLIKLYEDHGFRFLREDPTDNMITMYTKLKK